MFNNAKKVRKMRTFLKRRQLVSCFALLFARIVSFRISIATTAAEYKYDNQNFTTINVASAATEKQ